MLSRAELLLSSECSAQPALDAAVYAMEGAVDAWSRVEAEEAEKRRKEAEILKYKMQEHVVRCRAVLNTNTCTHTCDIPRISRQFGSFLFRDYSDELSIRCASITIWCCSVVLCRQGIPNEEEKHVLSQ